MLPSSQHFARVFSKSNRSSLSYCRSAQSLAVGKPAPARRLIIAPRTHSFLAKRLARVDGCPSRPPFRVDVASEASSLARRASAQCVWLSLDLLRGYQPRSHPPRCFSHPRGDSVPPMRSFFRPLPLMGFPRFDSRHHTVAVSSLRISRRRVACSVYFNEAGVISAVCRQRFTDQKLVSCLTLTLALSPPTNSAAASPRAGVLVAVGPQCVS